MSRRKRNDNLNPVQLFPFVAVLLCTMGSLLVLLVGVARSSRNQALEQLAAKKEAAAALAAAPIDEKLQQELDKIHTFVAQLDILRVEAEQQLQNDQRRLSHMEDHMRRLQAQLESLRLAAEELNAEEGSHYDDREQAQRELQRLEQLIEESRQSIAELRAETNPNRRSIAILPSEGRDGTRRPPIFVECTDEGVILQPEGIRLTEQDFLGPPGPSSPLAAALRAAREHIVKSNPGAGTGEDSEPYALLVVRPGGTQYFQQACTVIHRAGMDFGYELVDSDWDLKYPAPDPQLASAEYQATELARRQLMLLASAAPRMFGGGARYAGSGGPGGEPSGGGGGGGGGGSGAPRRPLIGTRSAAAGAEMSAATDAADANTAGAPPGQKSASRVRFDTDESGDLAPGERGAASADDSHEYLAGQMPQPRRPSPRRDMEEEMDDDEEIVKPHGKDWAIKQMPGTVPIRRPIHVVVRQDHLAILREPGVDDGTSPPAGREIPLRGSTDAAIGTIVKELKAHIAEWGIAGQGLAWRPVLELNVGPDGQHRADDLTRLLRDSGIEVRRADVAQLESGEPSRASR